MKILILGAGLSGLSVAYNLGKRGFNNTLIEKNRQVGGLSSTFRGKNGFVFDKTLHVLHIKTEYVKKLIHSMLEKEIIKHRRQARIFLDGEILPYPFQSNFYRSKNRSLVKDCENGLRRISKNAQNSPILNFEEFIYGRFGEGIAKHFMVPYNTKIWTVAPRYMTYEWVRKYIPEPNPSEVLQMLARYREFGAAKDSKWGYNPEFLYLREGGIQRVAESLFQRLNRTEVILNNAVSKVEVKKKTIELKNQEKINYDLLLSTIPLPHLIELIENSQKLVKLQKERLHHTSIYNINFGLAKPMFAGIHWMYFPEPELPFYRIGFPSNLSSKMTPNGCSSMSIEVAYSKENRINFGKTRQNVIKKLMKVGLLKKREDIIFEVNFDIKYGYVIPDSDYLPSRRIVINYLTSNGILPLGRFGAWQYSSMEDAINEGKDLAFEILSKYSNGVA